MGRRGFLAGSAALAALALVGCVTPADEIGGSDADNLDFQGRLLPEPVAKPDLVFTDTEGRPYDLRTATDGQLTMVLFGYTSCPDICPIHMGAIAPAIEDARLRSGKPNVVFVGVDTARDTPSEDARPSSTASIAASSASPPPPRRSTGHWPRSGSRRS